MAIERCGPKINSFYMKPIQLNRLGLQELSGESLLVINGGAAPKKSPTKWFRGALWAYLAEEIIDHWGEIKKGFKEGWDVDNHHK